MFITKQNKVLYDTKNFDLSKNVYTVLIDNTKVKANIDNIDNYDILNVNIIQDIFWIYFPELDLSTYKNEWKVVYGHFYNNSDMFIYKNIHNGQVVGHSIQKTYIEKLYYNKNKLLYNKSYKRLLKQLDTLNEKNRQDYKSYQPTVTYIYDNETIFFGGDYTNYIGTEYVNGCLILTYTDKTKMILN